MYTISVFVCCEMPKVFGVYSLWGCDVSAINICRKKVLILDGQEFTLPFQMRIKPITMKGKEFKQRSFEEDIWEFYMMCHINHFAYNNEVTKLFLFHSFTQKWHDTQKFNTLSEDDVFITKVIMADETNFHLSGNENENRTYTGAPRILDEYNRRFWLGKGLSIISLLRLPRCICAVNPLVEIKSFVDPTLLILWKKYSRIMELHRSPLMVTRSSWI